MLLHMPMAVSQESKGKTYKVSYELTKKFSQYYLYIVLVSASHNSSPSSRGGKISYLLMEAPVK